MSSASKTTENYRYITVKDENSTKYVGVMSNDLTDEIECKCKCKKYHRRHFEGKIFAPPQNVRPTRLDARTLSLSQDIIIRLKFRLNLFLLPFLCSLLTFCCDLVKCQSRGDYTISTIFSARSQRQDLREKGMSQVSESHDFRANGNNIS